MLKSLMTSRVGMNMALGVGRALSPKTANRLIERVSARIVATPDSGLAHAARVNQYVASGGTLTGEALDAAVLENVRMMVRFLYDLYHVIGNDAAEDAAVVRDDAFHSFIERDRAEGPFVYVGAHMGNFDLVGRLLARNGWHMQILSVADPNEGYQWQNDARNQAGFEVTPVSIESMKVASRRLEGGRSVLTGLDRPLPEPDKVQPRFFGRPAPMPLLHVRMAMRAHVPVIVATGRRRPDGRYELMQSEPIVMQGDRPTPEALLLNAEACLGVVERWVTETPAQWSMPHVAWPDVVVPG